MLRTPQHLWSAVRLFGATFAGCLAFLWLLVEVHAHFQLGWFPALSADSLRVFIMICVSVVAGEGAVTGSLFWRALKTASKPQAKPSFEQSLVDALGAALEQRHYAEVIRIGGALTRPLFEEGMFVTRLQIGKIVEEAAALAERREEQAEALIDAIGWSLVELGQYEEARCRIEHGIRIGEELGADFWQAKGQRHLGVIARRNGQYDKALAHYQASLEMSKRVPETHRRDVLVAGLHYAFASLHYHTGEYAKAMTAVTDAIRSFAALKDTYRLNMSCVMKGDIQFRLNENDRARDTYRSVLTRANENTELLQAIRARLGLAELFMSEHNWKKARENAAEAARMNRDQFKAEAERLKLLMTKLPPTESAF